MTSGFFAPSITKNDEHNEHPSRSKTLCGQLRTPNRLQQLCFRRGRRRSEGRVWAEAISKAEAIAADCTKSKEAGSKLEAKSRNKEARKLM